MVCNLAPTAEGGDAFAVEIPGSKQHVRVVVIDTEQSIVRTVAGARSDAPTRSLTLHSGLPSDQHLMEKQAATLVPYGTTHDLVGATTSSYKARPWRACLLLFVGLAPHTSTPFLRLCTYCHDLFPPVFPPNHFFQVFNTLDDVARLIGTLSSAIKASTKDWAFLLKWGTLNETAKAAAYAKHACHELAVFVYRKDRAFFDALIAPLIANKLRKTFVDRCALQPLFLCVGVCVFFLGGGVVCVFVSCHTERCRHHVAGFTAPCPSPSPRARFW